MNDYMQQNSDLGSIFVVQYHKDKDGDKDGKGKTAAGRGKGGRTESEALEDDALVSVDDDDQTFTLNECAHLCALLNDLHLQFNDMRHGKYSTAAMVHLLMQHRREDPGGGVVKADKKISAGGGAGKVEAPAEPVGVKGSLMAVAGTFINRFLTGSEKRQEDSKNVSREARALLQQEVERGKGKHAIERLTDGSAEKAVGRLRARQADNMSKAEEAAMSHKCTSRCADGKCIKFDWDYNCPVQCSCQADVPSQNVVWCGKWCFCEWYETRTPSCMCFMSSYMSCMSSSMSYLSWYIET